MKGRRAIVLGFVAVGIAAAVLLWPGRSDPLARLRSLHRQSAFVTRLANLAGFVRWKGGEAAAHQHQLSLENEMDLEAMRQVDAGNMATIPVPETTFTSAPGLRNFARTNFKDSLWFAHTASTNPGTLLISIPLAQSNGWVRRLAELRATHESP